MEAKFKNIALALGLALAVGATTVAQSQTSRAVGQRQATMKTFQASMGAINAELKKPMPDVAAIQTAAKTFTDTANRLDGLFPAGSGPGPRTKAKAEIWSNPVGFSGAVSAFQLEVSKLNQAALSGNVEAIRAQVPKAAQGCGGCHKPFREAAPAAPAKT